MVDDRVVAAAAVDAIPTAVAIERVVAAAGVNDVRLRIAHDGHSAGVAAGVDALDIDDLRRTDTRDVGDLGCARKIDRHAARQNEHVVACAAVDQRLIAVGDDRIVASAGVDDIRTAAAIDGIVARTAGDDVAARRAVQRVGRRRGTRHVGDADEDIAFGVAAVLGAARAEVDRNADARGRVVGGVMTAAANERIRASAARERIVAAVAADRIVEGAADDILEAVEYIALGEATAGSMGAEVDRHASLRTFVGKCVDPRAAVQRIRAGARHDRIVSIARIHVGARRICPQHEDAVACRLIGQLRVVSAGLRADADFLRHERGMILHAVIVGNEEAQRELAEKSLRIDSCAILRDGVVESQREGRLTLVGRADRVGKSGRGDARRQSLDLNRRDRAGGNRQIAFHQTN